MFCSCAAHALALGSNVDTQNSGLWARQPLHRELRVNTFLWVRLGINIVKFKHEPWFISQQKATLSKAKATCEYTVLLRL